MSTLTHTKFIGTSIKEVPNPDEITGSFSITKDGLHFEIVKSDDTYSFKIFDLLTTKLLQEGEIERR